MEKADLGLCSNQMNDLNVRQAGSEREVPKARMRFCHGKFRLFGHFVHAQFVLLALIEFGLISAVSYSVNAGSAAVDASGSFLWLLLSAVMPVVAFSFSLAAMGLYDTRQRQSFNGIASRIVVAILFGMVLCACVGFVFPQTTLTAGSLGLTSLGSLAVVAIVRGLFYAFVDGHMLRKRVIVIGVGQRASSIDRLRRKSDMRAVNLLGFVCLDESTQREVDQDRILKIKGSIRDFAIANRVDEIVIALDDRRQKLPVEDLLDCRMSGIDIVDMLDFFERERGIILLSLLYPGWLVFAKGFAPDALRAFKKRALDWLVSFVLLLVFAPFMLLTALAIYIESGFKGPILYRQKRVGRHGHVFDVIKFRSMRTDAEASGKAQWAVDNDPRVTRVGHFIRKYRLDELPQLWNVFVGDMSLVGPRPERPEFVEHLGEINSLYRERHRLSPGVTGWAQLCYPYGASDEDSIQKLQYDLYYVKNHSIFLDIYILIQTVEVVLFKKGSR